MNRLLLSAFATGALAAAAAAQSGGGFDLTWNATAAGGVTAATGGGFRLAASSDVEEGAALAGGSFHLDGGFWPGVCGSFIQSYGAGCAGSGGIVPQFSMRGCDASGYDVVLEVQQGLGGGQAFLFLGLGQAALPMGGGCLLNVFPLLPGPIGPLPLTPGGPGGGSLTLPVTVPPITAVVATITHQVFVSDPGAPSGTGFSNTNGVAVHLGG